MRDDYAPSDYFQVGYSSMECWSDKNDNTEDWGLISPTEDDNKDMFIGPAVIPAEGRQ